MAIRIALYHRTLYRYDRPVKVGPQVVRLRPAPHCRTTIRSYALRVHPREHFLNWQQDPHANYLARIVFEKPMRELCIEVELTADLETYNPFDFFLEDRAEEVPFAYEVELSTALAPYRKPVEGGPLLQALMSETTPQEGVRTIDYLVGLNTLLCQRIHYLLRMEPGVQSPEHTLQLGRGSCRDSAWLLIALLRAHGFAARFASGYLVQLRPDVKPLQGPPGPAADFTDLHAWAEVFLPGAGWVGLDPTSGLFAGEGHLPLACTPEPSSAAPISGQVDVCEVEFAHEMSVTRVHEPPRVAHPYSDDVWRQVSELAGVVEDKLFRGDVRLTMGGEPTFVAEADPDAEEWNTSAVGPTKRRYGDLLFERLVARFAGHGLRHFGQGKWYPGEALPRWANSCFFRRDGTPLWRDARWVALTDADSNHTSADAERFMLQLAAGLEVGDEHVLAGYEDPFYYAWRERRLPVNVDALDCRLSDPLERERLVKVFRTGLGSVAGYALPITPVYEPGRVRFRSGEWFLRDEHMYLWPGDSPMGLRLPLDSLPWVAEADYPYVVAAGAWTSDARTPFGRHVPIITPQEQGAMLLAERQQFGTPAHNRWDQGDRAPAAFDSAQGVVRTALCVEAREGMLHVFMPPLDTFDAYAELVSAVEATCAQLELPVRLEGYPPPSDVRVDKLSVTPDPGVLEVNIHPSHSWAELEENTRILYEEARNVGLKADKFQLDGRQTGTGGGNHITLGGITPSDSPLLRRPDLLRSMVGYWNDHPSLSYLFSGQFIGPTSQAPRVDEARHEQLHELEIAFEQIPDAGDLPPWLVDRVLRHLLTDLTGNTHRAEFCIDKLYSPDSASGRLGILELRAFEMPPHPEMSLVQQLLVRALVARFWERPYHPRLTRWGTSLHDRFLLPHFVREDFDDVLDEMADQGYVFDPAWFTPHFEFRFPLIGEVAYDNVQMELRQALEPWNVLGEESGGGGTARFVDSSLERLQIRVSGAIPERHGVMVNGYRAPLHPTGTQGEYVCGVRFRAWQPPSCLHPTIGTHDPLVFDVVDDVWGRSLGGCTYYVSHPGGRSFETRPINAAEAETRVRARYSKIGHTPGQVTPRETERSRDFPLTLDLRRAQRSSAR